MLVDLWCSQCRCRRGSKRETLLRPGQGALFRPNRFSDPVSAAPLRPLQVVRQNRVPSLQAAGLATGPGPSASQDAPLLWRTRNPARNQIRPKTASQHERIL